MNPGGRRAAESLRSESGRRRVAVALHEEIESWLDDGKAPSWVRLLSGGPGSGKSTFARMLSAIVSRAGKRRVLYVPLHQLDVSADLVTAVDRFVERDRFLTANPLDPKTGDARPFLVLDGLDELALQGKVGAEVASDFVAEVRRTVERLNDQEADVRVLITGRPVAVDPQRTQFRKPGQLLHALPYEVPEDERERYRNQELLQEDQREIWWRRYGECSGKEYEGLPRALGRDDLSEITRQPLLNYLLALSFERGKIDFSQETSLNQIYGDLLDAVYERQWGPGGPHPAVGELEIQDFRRVLEEIAIAAWHGNGRTASMQEIESRFRRLGMGPLLDEFAGGAEAGIGRLLLAFYFRRAGRREGGEATFEFTHKSFGEYLVARRLVGMIGTVRRRLEEREGDFEAGWDERQALEKWAGLTGPTALEMNLLEFLRQEVALEEKEQVREWQRRLAKLLSRDLESGLPMERIDPKLTSYFEMTHWAKNAEETLLAVLNACARATGNRTKVDWPSPTSLGDLICRLRGQRAGPFVLALRCLSHCEAEDSILHMADLYGADLSRCSLNSLDARAVMLEGAILVRATLRSAILVFANLQGANLQGADLREASLMWADLQGAELQGADLQGVDLRGANLQGANLQGANVQGANVQGASLQGAHLGENFPEEHFLGTELSPGQLDQLGLSQSQVERIRKVAAVSEED